MKPFNLLSLIIQHNKLYPRNPISLDKTMGLAYLSSDGLSVLNAIAELINTIKQTRSYRSQTKYLSNYRQSLQIFKHSVSSPDFFWQARKLCQTARTLITTNKLHSWEAEQVAWLNDENNWSRLIAINPEAKGSLIKLKQFWDRQKLFCSRSNAFLLKAMESLSEPQQHLALADREFLKKKHKLPIFIAESYGAFLAELRKELDQTKESLLNAMASRLFVAGKMASTTSHVHYDDVLVYTIQELQRFSVIKSTMRVSGYWQSLEPKHFTSFHQYIQREGNTNLFKEISQLPWFSETKGAIESKNIMIDGHCYVIPSILAKHVPTKRRWPAWLFHHQHRCIDFIQQQQAMFANLKLGLPTTRHVDPKERFLRLDKYEQHCKTAIAELQKHQPKPWQLWSYLGYRQLLSEYRNLLTKQSQHCLHERIELLEEIAHRELPPQDREERYQLWLLAREQLAYLNNLYISKDLVTRINNVEIKLSTSLQQEPTAYVTCLLQALADNQELQTDELSYIIEYIEINELSSEKDKWLDTIKPYRCKAVTSLLSQAKQLLSQSETNLTSPILLNKIKLIQSLGDKKIHMVLQQAIKRLPASQTHLLNQEEPSLARSRLSCIQHFVYEYGDQETKDWLNKLGSNTADTNWRAFLARWQLSLKELQLSNSMTIQTNKKLALNSHQQDKQHSHKTKPYHQFLSLFGTKPAINSKLSTSAPTKINHLSLLMRN
jgi:hypothetical protein